MLIILCIICLKIHAFNKFEVIKYVVTQQNLFSFYTLTKLTTNREKLNHSIIRLYFIVKKFEHMR